MQQGGGPPIKEMLQTAEKHYLALCDMPQCMCVGCTVFIFFKDPDLSTDGLPYIMGTVTAIEELTSGGVDVTIQYDDATLPVTDPEFEVIFPGVAEEGTVCDPDCGGVCDWVTKVKRMIESALPGGLINRHYQLYTSEEDVANGVFLLPRIPFVPGYRLTDVRITCFTYDLNTSATFELKVGASVKANFTGTLAQQRQLAILDSDLDNDELPELHITGLTNNVYGLAAAGLVIELIGIIVPSP